ncbi:FAD-dependent monooxygenase [Nocardia sp. NPDC088792]|uniref:FAD-dependent monooxygenase n=1 Tax=Nocardia sp. NPDC088792 TaxID=3364332 RepID=UPI003816FA86
MTVLIAGAGPTGSTLACELARRNIPCRVIDKASRLFPGSRGKGLTPRTQEVFEDLGVLGAVRAAGIPFPEFRMYSGHEIVSERTLSEMLGIEPPVPTEATPYPDLWLLPQWQTDRILHDRFTELGGSVEFDTELTGFTQHDDAVTAALVHHDRIEHFRAGYLVGADGGRSTVRKALDVGFAGEAFDTERTLIGDVRADGLDGEFWGQGLNTSVQDAYNLGWKMAAVLAGAPDALLDTYQDERLPVAAHVLGITTATHRANFRTPVEQAPAIHQLDINYRSGPLAVDDRPVPGRLQAGDRAPDAYDIDDGSYVLVRPDGYIGVITPSVARLAHYLDRFSTLRASR